MTSCLCKQSPVFSIAIDLAGLATCEAGAGSVGGEGDPWVGVVVHTAPAAAHWTPGHLDTRSRTSAHLWLAAL